MSATTDRLGQVGLPSRWIIAITAVTILCIPVDFVIIAPPVPGILNLLLGVAAVIGILAVLRGRRRAAVHILIWMGASVILTAAWTGAWVASVTTAAPLIVGLAAGLITRRRLLFVGAYLLLITATIVLEFMLGEYWVSNLFGEPRFASYATAQELRPRGIVGAALVVSSVAVALACYAFAAAEATKRPGVWRLASIVAATLAVLITQSRSSLIAVILVLGAVLTRFRGPISPAVVVLGSAGLAGSILVLSSRIDDLLNSRLLSLDNLQGTASLENRMQAFTILENRDTECSAACWLFGEGPRALGGTLRGRTGAEFSTVDNTFVTLLWDFGLVGTFAWALIGGYAWIAARDTKASLARRGAACALMAIFFSGFFFDVVYLRVCMFVVGAALAVVIVEGNQTHGSSNIRGSSNFQHRPTNA